VAKNNQIRQQITDQIVAALERNLLPWRRPWTASKNTGRAANVISKRAYSGVNPLILELHRLGHGFSSRFYGTFEQWRTLGCVVKKRPKEIEQGHWGAKIILYRPLKKTRVDDSGDEQEDRFFLIRYFTVFNADQVEGAERWQAQAEESEAIVPDFAPADELIAATSADIRHHGDQAFYHRLGDFIQVPQKSRFNPPGAYYETILHELSHWSEPRLDWDHKKAGYAMCELVAEMSSSFLATELGVPQGESLENHAAYLKHWLDAMRADAGFIFKAATQASKVADFLTAFVLLGKEQKQPEKIPA
jgi:antirestriction protein ArdC